MPTYNHAKNAIERNTGNVIRSVAYDLYRRHWLSRQMIWSSYEAYSCERIFDNIVNWMTDEDRDRDDPATINAWEEDPFHGICYVCFDEFLGAEYLDREFMHNLFRPFDYEETLWQTYLRDVKTLE